MANPSRIDETALTKGQRRKLNALRKSVGEEIGEQAFAAWLSAQSGGGQGRRRHRRADDRRCALASDQGGNTGDPAGRLSAPARPRAYHCRTCEAVAPPIRIPCDALPTEKPRLRILGDWL